MRAEALRAVLLAKAIEETDREGKLVPAADRVAASRAARRANAGVDDPEVLLSARSERLLERVAARHGAVASALAASSALRWIPAVLVAASLAAGFGLSALDGTQRINILGFPLLGVVLWNLAVYAALLVRWNSGSEPDFAFARAQAASGADPALGEALSRFAGSWWKAARPLYAARAGRAMHLAALALALGLVGGLYLRGLVLEYHAIWESTFLDAAQVRSLVSIVYGPAAMATGVALPDAAELEAIRASGESAARWIHLMAATIALFVVIPRAILAAAKTARLARLARDLPAPEDLQPYFRAVFAEGERLGRARVLVVPYACSPSRAAVARMETLLPQLLAGELALELDAPTPYGEEEALLTRLEARGGGGADVLVLLFSLAATPEDENHGALIGGARDLLARKRARSELVVLVDEAPYRARLGEAARERLDERRAAWRAFVGARGLEARFVELS